MWTRWESSHSLCLNMTDLASDIMQEPMRKYCLHNGCHRKYITDYFSGDLPSINAVMIVTRQNHVPVCFHTLPSVRSQTNYNKFKNGTESGTVFSQRYAQL